MHAYKLSHLRDGNLLSVDIGPSDLLLHLVLLMLSLVHGHHLSLLLREFNLVLEHQLPVCLLLHGPLSLLLVLHGLQLLLLNELLLPLILNLSPLLRCQTLEVVGDKPVLRGSTQSGSRVFSHEVAAVDVCDLKLVLTLLLRSPLLLSLPLF
jgi:hypothetical protein